jgi:hypothetical protein
LIRHDPAACRDILTLLAFGARSDHHFLRIVIDSKEVALAYMAGAAA